MREKDAASDAPLAQGCFFTAEEMGARSVDGDAPGAPKMATPGGAVQLMLSGRELDLLSPRPEQIAIEDIAHGLARVARWNGQTKGPHIFSVAQHSLLVERIFCEMARGKPRPPAEQLYALLHDAPEYVIGDLISPFKAAVGANYKKIEHDLEDAICQRFRIPSPITKKLKAAVKAADRIAAYREAVLLAGFDKKYARSFAKPHKDFLQAGGDITPKPIDDVQLAFLERFDEIIAQMSSVA